MSSDCQIHNKPFSIACLEEECSQRLLCLSCFRSHPEKHEKTQPFEALQKDRSWLRPFAEERDRLLHHEVFQHSFHDSAILAHNERLINQLIESIIFEVREKGRQLIEEMKIRFENHRPLENTGARIREIEELLRSVTFEHYEISDQIQELAKLKDDIAPSARKLIQGTEEKLKAWTIEQSYLAQIDKTMKEYCKNITLDGILERKDNLKKEEEHKKGEEPKKGFGFGIGEKISSLKNTFKKSEEKGQGQKKEEGENMDDKLEREGDVNMEKQSWGQYFNGFIGNPFSKHE